MRTTFIAGIIQYGNATLNLLAPDGFTIRVDITPHDDGPGIMVSVFKATDDSGSWWDLLTWHENAEDLVAHCEAAVRDAEQDADDIYGVAYDAERDLTPTEDALFTEALNRVKQWKMIRAVAKDALRTQYDREEAEYEAMLYEQSITL